ncbi:MAG TPA: S1 family peptidase [Thermomicrobiales bacterium]|nr:S1 family peptidase [Thermomicrobiales bacterium]
MAANQLSVGSKDVVQTSNFLATQLGPDAPAAVRYASIVNDNFPAPEARPGRERIFGPIRGGDRFTGDEHPESYYCSAGFGAWDKGTMPSNGQPVLRYFMVTVGHCAYDQERMRRRNRPGEGNKTQIIGLTARRGYDNVKSTFDTDASAIRLEGNPRGLTPRYINMTGRPEIAIRGVVEPRVGMIVCQSGVTADDERCGKMIRLTVRIDYDNQRMLQVAYNAVARGGDSGAPVWQKGTQNFVGIVTAGSENADEEETAPSYFTPVRSPTGYPNMPGIFRSPEFASLHLLTAE